MANHSVAAHAKKVRAKLRQRLGPLKHLPVSPATILRYKIAGRKFASWFSIRWPQQTLKKGALVDKFLSKYLEHLWQTNEGLFRQTQSLLLFSIFDLEFEAALKKAGGCYMLGEKKKRLLKLVLLLPWLDMGW